MYGLPRNVAERTRRVLPRYFALRCCHDRRRQRRRPCVLTGWKTRCLSAGISLFGIGFSCRRCSRAMLQGNEDGKRELKAKRAFRGGAITVREKKRACEKFNFQIYENVFRESTNPLSKLSACFGYSTAFRLFHAFHLSISANPYSRHSFESDIVKIQMRGAITLFLMFSKNASLNFRIPHISQCLCTRLISDYIGKRVYLYIITWIGIPILILYQWKRIIRDLIINLFYM